MAKRRFRARLRAAIDWTDAAMLAIGKAGLVTSLVLLTIWLIQWLAGGPITPLTHDDVLLPAIGIAVWAWSLLCVYNLKRTQQHYTRHHGMLVPLILFGAIPAIILTGFLFFPDDIPPLSTSIGLGEHGLTQIAIYYPLAIAVLVFLYGYRRNATGLMKRMKSLAPADRPRGGGFDWRLVWTLALLLAPYAIVYFWSGLSPVYAWVSTVIAPQLAASGIAGAELIIALLLGWDWNSD
jgi:hypothetical protein